MRFHGRLLDPSLAPQFMVFKRRVIAIYNANKALRDNFPEQQWPVQFYDRILQTPEFWVQMRILGDDVWVMMMGAGSMYFEFHTTNYPVDRGSAFGFDATYAGVVGVTVAANLRSTLQGGRKTLTTSDIGPLFRSAQTDLMDEQCAYPIKEGSTFPRVLYESYAPMSPHTGAFERAYHCGWLPFSYITLGASGSANEIRDYGMELPWEDSQKINRVRYAYLSGNADWPRATGIQMVRDSIFGDLEFAIHVDAFDQVSVFPTTQILPGTGGTDFLYGSDLQNVPPTMVQTQRVPFPSWVYKKTQKFKDYFAANADVGLNDFPEIDWKVHPDGTEMCAVVHEREVAEFDAAFFGTYATDIGTQGPSFMYPDAASFYLMNAQAMGAYPRLNGQKASTFGDPWYMVATGLLKVTISIVRTGLLPEQYAFNLSVTEVRRPTTTPYCTFVAGYAFHDIKDLALSTDEVPVWHARRGEMLALDIECYGHTSNGNCANLFSLKNLTQGREVNTFGAMNSTSNSPVVDVGTLLTAQESILLASDMRTLSFAIRTGTNKFNDIPIKNHETMHFGVAIIVMNGYRRTLFPETIDADVKAIIKDANENDARERMEAQMPGMSLLPLNDLRTWGNADLDSLRESYCWTPFKEGTYSPPIQPLENFDHIQTVGWKFYRNGARLTAPVTAAAQLWYDSLMTQGGIKPFPMFDLANPRPGWYLYMGQMISRLFQSSYTAFFTHPDGSWAFYDQQFIYNLNGMYRDGGGPGPGYNSCDPAKLEHCIFDVVSFSSTKQHPAIETSYLKLYNLAVKDIVDDLTIEKHITTLKPDYSDIKIRFTVNPKADSIDPTVIYAEIQMDWYPSFTCYYVERWYWTGTRDFGIGFESQSGGGFQLYALTQFAQLVSGAPSSFAPMEQNNPVRFSSAVLISPT